ncbi:NrfD/PsrC family molybdoenzyme membrane anchor subunit [Tepidiforma sp.]|uniref:NrfD/PsrC family molybdoenzyme membrane anchor subunit n=1 Tax=Tepidiforma sp. TaxID=2682230 RepID=UPI002ADD5AD2|nr:NrfD/PsrC family molybdoenzyme membrane anchor subunit [Tepidiforma sp.]
MSPRLLKSAFWAVGIILILIGSWAWIDRFLNADKNANYGSIVPWGLWVAAYIYFIGLSAGSFLVSSLVYVFNIKRFESIGRLALYSAVVTLLLALLSISADLGHPFRAWHVLVYPNFRSPMAWMIWLYSAYFILLILELWFVLRHDLVVGSRRPGWRGRLYRILVFGSNDDSPATRASDRQVVRFLATIGVPLAVMFHGGVGSLFGVVASRPAWHGGLFPILFLVSALVSGGALLVLVSAIFQDGLRRNRQVVLDLAGLVLALLAFDLLLQISETLVGFYGNEPDRVENLRLIYGGPYWWVFWVWQLALGTLVPIVLLASPWTRRNPVAAALACGLIAIGFLAVRLNIVIPGLADEQLEGITQAFNSTRIATDYVPSLMEFTFTAGIIGIGLVLFGLGEWFLPRSQEESAQEEVARVSA